MKLSNASTRVLALFYEISAIPRPSGHEERIAEYIESFAKAHGCEVYRDALNNVFVRVAATRGYEDRAPILLQGHTDMVCEKNASTVHDFMNEGIRIVEEDGFLRADGTTLGADNGVAVAIMLYVIEGGVPAHGEIECLFTASEEVGLDGVQGFDFSLVHSRRMINLDSGTESTVTVGCAGGVTTDIMFPAHYTAAEGTQLSISVRGLAGGHSGSDIGKCRANAIVLLSRLLCELYTRVPLSLISLSGGDKDNAIPREATAVIAVEDADTVCAATEKYVRDLRAELSEADMGFSLSITQPKTQEEMMDGYATRAILSFLACVKNGVLSMSASLPALIEHSQNLASVRTESRGVIVTVSSRSAIERQLEESMRTLDILASTVFGVTHHRGRYPGWAYTEESDIAKRYLATAKALYGTEIQKEVIHAGLECGIIKGRLPEMDCISCGPNLYALHSTEEKLDLASLERVTAIICKLLSEL